MSVNNLVNPDICIGSAGGMFMLFDVHFLDEYKKVSVRGQYPTWLLIPMFVTNL
jgi:hypothetical protein